MPNFISEDAIEQVLKLLHGQFGYDLLNCYTKNIANVDV